MTSLPQIFYGLHMRSGTAEYRERDQAPLRIFIGDEVLNQMDATFAGCPLFVDHVDKVNLSGLRESADGYVIESFFLPCDGSHWAKFIAVSDKSKEAIQSGYKLSNAYVPQEFGPGGLNHGVAYEKEVTRAMYEHLALVESPRYEESVILTPEQFKKYVEEKELELARVANSKSKEQGEKMFFWKKTRVENSSDMENTMVELPKSGTTADLKTVINDADRYRLEMKEPHMVDVGGEKMNAEELAEKHLALKDELEGLKKEHEGLAEKHNALLKDYEDMKKDKAVKAASDSASDSASASDEDKDKDKDKAVKSASDEDKDKDKDKAVKAASDEDEDKDKKKNELFHDLYDVRPIREEDVSPDLSSDRVARGKKRYGFK